ncbi:MlaD family protein [Nocardia sp. CA-135398]|uniref:MlaD family protein n=1 Tax=Nocardia sp. CA-135398 TaxID=3239977 RepID=UPI003D965C7F
MKMRLLVSGTAIVVVPALGVGYMVLGALRIRPFADYTTVRMLLQNSRGLNTGSPVLLQGVEVGKVTGVHTAASGVETTLRVDDTYRIPADSAVRIENLSALGEPYVDSNRRTRCSPSSASPRTCSSSANRSEGRSVSRRRIASVR